MKKIKNEIMHHWNVLLIGIAARFGMVRIPVDLVQLSMHQEEFFENLVDAMMINNAEGVAEIMKYQLIQIQITSYLRAGRQIVKE